MKNYLVVGLIACSLLVMNQIIAADEQPIVVDIK